MCFAINTLKIQTFTHTLHKLQAAVGVKELWAVNVRTLPGLRRLALDGRLGTIEYLVKAAIVHASKAQFAQAVEMLRATQRQLAELKAEAAARPIAADAGVIVLDDDWGKKGRGAKIVAWIHANGNATAEHVAARFQLARSTAQAYIRKAKKALATAKAA